jgi:hypothetical protein
VTSSVTVNVAKLRSIRAGLKPLAEKVLAKTARDIERRWKEYIIIKDVIDTSAYLNSVKAEPDGDSMHWDIHDGVDYGVYQEFGAEGRGARPCLGPAVEDVKPGFIKAWRQMESL